MFDVSSATLHQSDASRASLIYEAHRFLLALLRGEPSPPLSSPALHWLAERDLLAEVPGADGLRYEITPRGRNAVLGKQQRQILLN